MDIVTAYLYGKVDNDIYMRTSAGLENNDKTPSKTHCVKLQRSLYGLKQSGRMWYQ